jgi:hypothetical protein
MEKSVPAKTIKLQNCLKFSLKTPKPFVPAKRQILFIVIATTQPTTQNKTKQFGWSGIIIGKKTTPCHHTTTTM